MYSDSVLDKATVDCRLLDQVMAACGSPMWGMNQSGVRDDGKGGGKPYANMFFYNGGMGGNTRRDGVTCLSWPSNVSSTSIDST